MHCLADAHAGAVHDAEDDAVGKGRSRSQKPQDFCRAEDHRQTVFLAGHGEHFDEAIPLQSDAVEKPATRSSPPTGCLRIPFCPWPNRVGILGCLRGLTALVTCGNTERGSGPASNSTAWYWARGCAPSCRRSSAGARQKSYLRAE